MLDPNFYRHVLNPVAFVRERLRLRPDPLQERVLASPHRRGILCCTRQWGKSTTTAARAVHQAFFYPGSLILIAAPAGRQSGLAFQRCSSFLAKLGIPRRGDGINDISFVLPNGSRIVGLPNAEATIRGFSAPALILVDEAARVPDTLCDALSPMLATNDGALWLMSTPNGRDGFFYQEWFRQPSDWTRFTATAGQCPRIPPEVLAREARRMPRVAFEREYFCKFHAAQDALLQGDSLDNLLETAIPVLI